MNVSVEENVNKKIVQEEVDSEGKELRLRNIRDNIEALNIDLQLDFFNILKENEVVITENNNGYFIVMNGLSEKVLQQLERKIHVLTCQDKEITETEIFKKKIVKKYPNIQETKSFEL